MWCPIDKGIPPVPRFKITVEYFGKNYCGWQIQDHCPTAQGAIMQALHQLFKADIPVHGAGRTDSGVHASGQVAHFDADTSMTANKIREALNHFLYHQDVSILQCAQVADDFHARFSATSRHYLYRISNRRAPLTFQRDMVWHAGGYTLNAEKMHEAGQLLVGTHDFTTFRSAMATNQNPTRTLDYLHITEAGDEIHLRCGAKSFLHNQVRYMTGALLRVGYGKWNATHIQRCLDAKDRNKGGPLAPPHGLYLTEVRYDTP